MRFYAVAQAIESHTVIFVMKNSFVVLEYNKFCKEMVFYKLAGVSNTIHVCLQDIKIEYVALKDLKLRIHETV